MSLSILSVFVMFGLVTSGLVFYFAPRPKLNAAPQQHRIPEVPVEELDDWLAKRESEVPDLIESTQARIQWANAREPQKTRLSFLYLHGFSATWQETAPVTEQLAAHFSANVVQGRVAGHGQGPAGMLTCAEDWLQSTADQFQLARRVGEQVVIVATSTGAPLAVWLTSQPEIANKVHACLFMSPNFRIRNPFGFVLTWPWSRHWVYFIVGKQRKWEPLSMAEAECWTHEYSTLALIEMQKTVDWANKQAFEDIQVPLAMMYMQNDATVFPPAAIRIFNRWGTQLKRIYKVSIDGETDEHVFAGHITAPHRIEWTVETFREFLCEVDSISQ
ncbi:MAG: alpha/beta fold hydrolase [bacterium]|nr:hypothetical protein [Gammaproteobacteria bacterium]HIL97878.1 hypothetical protein [Pseudomonadales bacterium]